jgi:hypothetical protein
LFELRGMARIKNAMALEGANMSNMVKIQLDPIWKVGGFTLEIAEEKLAEEVIKLWYERQSEWTLQGPRYIAGPMVYGRLLKDDFLLSHYDPTQKYPSTLYPGDIKTTITLEPLHKNKIFVVAWYDPNDNGTVIIRNGDAKPKNFCSRLRWGKSFEGWLVNGDGEIEYGDENEATIFDRNDSSWPWQIFYPERFHALARIKKLLKASDENALTGLCKASDGGHRTLAKQVKRELEAIKDVLDKELLGAIMDDRETMR